MPGIRPDENDSASNCRRPNRVPRSTPSPQVDIGYLGDPANPVSLVGGASVHRLQFSIARIDPVTGKTFPPGHQDKDIIPRCPGVLIVCIPVRFGPGKWVSRWRELPAHVWHSGCTRVCSDRIRPSVFLNGG